MSTEYTFLDETGLKQYNDKVKAKYIEKLSVSGKTVTYTKGDGSTGTITTQDTTYSAAGSSLGLVKTGGDVTISAGVITVNDDSHNHVIDNVDGLQDELDDMQTQIDGSASSLALSGQKLILSTKSGSELSSVSVSNSSDSLPLEITENLVTERDVYYGLPQINGSKIYSSALDIYAPITSGEDGQILVASKSINIGSDSNLNTTYSCSNIPQWKDPADLIIGKADTLTSSAGSETQPVYFADGTPKVCTSLDLNTTGSAATLTTARTIQTNLASTSSASFDGSKNITPGVTGILPIINGGTGATTTDGVLTNLGLTATATELNYCDGVTSNVQEQLDNKSASNHTHSYLPLSGGTLTGDLYINSGTARVIIKNSLREGRFSVASNGTLGIYDATNNKFLLSSGTDGTITLGAATTISGLCTASGFRAGSGQYNGGGIELYAVNPYIDFHAGNSTADYVSRIYENGDSSAGHLRLISDRVTITGNGYAITMGAGFDSSNTAFLPVKSTSTQPTAADGILFNGASASRWNRVFAVNGVVTTSDERDKNIIGEIPQNYKDVFMELNAFIYKWSDLEDDVVHMGLGAQSVEQTLLDNGLTLQDFGAVEHDTWDSAYPIDESGRTDRYSMNYAELSVLTIPIVQDNVRKIEVLEAENAELRAEIAAIKETLGI